MSGLAGDITSGSGRAGASVGSAGASAVSGVAGASSGVGSAGASAMSGAASVAGSAGAAMIGAQMEILAKTQALTMKAQKKIRDRIDRNVQDLADYMKLVMCSSVSLPIGVINSRLPLSICTLSYQSQEDKSSVNYKSSRLPTTSISNSTSAELDGKNIVSSTSTDVSIQRITKILKEFEQTSKVSINAGQKAEIHCPRGLLDKNPYMKEMADIRVPGSDKWLPGMVDLVTCTNGEKLDVTDKEDSCDYMEWDDGTTTDRGGYNVTLNNGEKYEGINEFDENDERNIRWIFGCCPVVDQSIEIEVSQISESNETMLNEISNEINLMNESNAKISGCPTTQIKANSKIRQKLKVEQIAVIKQEIMQSNKQAIVAAQNIIYNDYYQTCFKGEPRRLKQDMDLKTLSVNIIDSAIKLGMQNEATLTSKTSVSLVYQKDTPRIFVFALILNCIFVYFCYVMIKELVQKMRS